MNKHLDYPQIPFDALLKRAADRWPDKTAVVFGRYRLTFSQMDCMTNQLAHGLWNLGIRFGDRVGIYTPNCPEYELAFLACSRTGAIPTPLNPAYKERELRHQLGDSGATAVFVHESLYPVLAAARHELPVLRQVIVIGAMAPEGCLTIEELAESQPDTAPDLPIRWADVAALPYSSGTTGTSKGVILTHRNLVCNALQYADATQSTEEDSVLIFLPLYHIYGVALMSSAMASGAGQVLMPRFDLAEVVRLLQVERITVLYVVPPIMLALANTPGLTPEQFASLRFIMSAAAPLSIDVARRVIERLHVPVIQAYGMTETSPLTHMVPLDRADELLGTVGVVVADTECRIMDLEHGVRELPPGEVGEITMRGPQMMSGYWNAETDTQLTLRNGWIYSGDIGYADEQGNLYIVDRKKEMIKYKAFSIAPAELEAVLLEHPAVLDCGVTAQPDDEAGEVPRAYVVLRPGFSASPEELQAFVTERVAGFKQIRAVEMVEAIPRTPSGKILRRVLKEQARASA